MDKTFSTIQEAIEYAEEVYSDFCVQKNDDHFEVIGIKKKDKE